MARPTRGDLWPDFESREGTQKVGIEIVEVADDKHAKLREHQRRYAEHVARLLDDVSLRLAGLSITLEDASQVPPYPRLTEDAGQRLAREISERVRSVLPTLEALDVGQFYLNRWQGPPRPTIAAIVRRLAPRESGIPVAIGFSGVFSETVAAAQTRLARRICSKLPRRYQRYHDGVLWLLAYQVADAPAGTRDFAIAREMLRRRDSPFDEVWYIWPLAGADLGAIKRVWP